MPLVSGLRVLLKCHTQPHQLTARASEAPDAPFARCLRDVC
jgi:hypothetical protein